MSRAAIVRALEAIEDGDVGFAAELLQNALEDPTFPSVERSRCCGCGFTAEWPGLMWQHVCRAEVRRAA